MKDPRVDRIDPVAAVAEVEQAERVVRAAVRAEIGNLNTELADLVEAQNDLDARVETIERRFRFEVVAMAASMLAYVGALAFLRWKERRDEHTADSPTYSS